MSTSLRRSTRKRANTEIPPLVNKRTCTGGTHGITRSLGEDGTYYLPGERRPTPLPKTLPSFLPSIYGGSREQKRIPEYDYNTLTAVFKDIVKRYLPFEDETPKSFAQIHWTTSPLGFKPRFNEMLDEKIIIAVNEKKTDLGGKLADLQMSFFDEGGFKSIFQSWMNFLRRTKNLPESIPQYIASGQARYKCMQEIHKIGGTLRARAFYLGYEEVPQNELDELLGKHVVEDEAHVEPGLLSGFLHGETDKDPANYVVVDGTWSRIAAPPPDCKHAIALFFYKKDHPDDTDVTSEKIFGACIYHPEHASWLLSPEEECNEVDIVVNQELLKGKTAITRKRIASQGRMTKGLGKHSVYGATYDLELPHSDEIYGKDNVQIPEAWVDQYVKTRQEVLHQAFFPEHASQRMQAAEDVNLINPLGYPDFTSFSTVDYCAANHLDIDKCPTVAQCTHRPANMPRRTSNFFYARFKLILEMSPNMIWYWDASKCEHGTTPGMEALENNPKFTRAYIERRTKEAQWTRGTTIPKAVAEAHARRSKP